MRPGLILLHGNKQWTVSFNLKFLIETRFSALFYSCEKNIPLWQFIEIDTLVV